MFVRQYVYDRAELRQIHVKVKRIISLYESKSCNTLERLIP